MESYRADNPHLAVVEYERTLMRISVIKIVAIAYDEEETFRQIPVYFRTK